MKFHPLRLSLARSLVALAVSFAVVLSTHTFAFAFLPGSRQSETAPVEFRLTAASATATRAGVVIEWRTNSAADNLGFNIYRLQAGQRTRVNREIVPGAAFTSGAPEFSRGGYSYAWFDRAGTADSTYYIESVSLQGTAKTHEAIRALASKTVSPFEQTPAAPVAESASASESTDSFLRNYPTAEAGLSSPTGTLADQWAIAAQSGLKIGIKKDGWYRVTKAQMAAAGFNPSVEIRNLRLFVDAQEVAISTSQQTGPFNSGDYIEFYGRGLDLPTTDTQIYYLIAGTSPGKRVRGENQLSESPSLLPTPTPPPFPTSSPRSTPSSTPIVSPPLSAPLAPTATAAGPVLRDPIFYSSAQRDLSVWSDSLRSGNVTKSEAKNDDNPRVGNGQSNSAPAYNSPVDNFQPDISPPRAAPPVARTAEETADSPARAKPATVAAATAEAKVAGAVAPPSPARPALVRALRAHRRTSAKKRKGARRHEPKSERNHADVNPDYSPPGFDNTAERKDRTVYYSSLLNGDAENYFGQVLGYNPSNPNSQTITTPNPDLAAAGPARLEIALQGVTLTYHQISIEFNGVVVGSFSFFGRDPASGGHPVQTFDVPVSLLQNGANTIRFILPGGGDSSIVDYVKLSYPHRFRADANALRFNLRGTQSVVVDGFATPSVRLIDYTNPLAVSISRPFSEAGASGFAITVPLSEPRSKTPRLFYAIPDGQFEQPASLLLNQPASLNANSNTADFLIVSHKDLSASLEPLRAARANQGMTAKIVDVEDVYDEFSYGKHGPQAIKDFLSYAATHWNQGNNGAAPPRYLVFAGDASLDPRNYQGSGNFDLVPTKLVDATYNETASDDWLADFDGNGIADIPVGRLPVRTTAEADLVVSKIINYAPANVPQAAMLVADDPGSPPVWDFESGNDNVQALLPAGMTVQRVNVRTAGTTQSTADIIAGFNQGRAIVNYSGHGNVNVWASSTIFTTANATALTNGNKLSFVVVMDCLNGYYQDPNLLSLSEAFLKAPNGGAVAAFASSGLTTTFGQRQMELELYAQLYGGQPIALGDAIKIAKGVSYDLDVRTTWIFFGDPSMKIR